MADLVFGNSDELYSKAVQREVFKLGKKGRGKTVFFTILIVVLSLFLIAEAVYYLLVLPAVSSAKISFTGNIELSSVNLKNIAGLTGTEKWAQINTFELANKLARHPLIESVVAEKKFPDEVYISIKEREAVALSFMQVKDATIPVEIDRNGVIFRIGNVPDKKLPIISGLVFENAKAGMKVNRSLVSFFAQLGVLEAKYSQLINELSEIKIVEKKFGGYELLIYPVQVPVRVRMQNISDEQLLKHMMLILDVIKGIGLDSNVYEVDIRSGIAVYKQGRDNE